MKKTITVLIIGLCLLLTNAPQEAAAQIDIGVRFTPSLITYDSLWENENNTEINQWSGILEAEAHVTNDLLVHLSYGYTIGTKINGEDFSQGQSTNSTNGTAAIMYNLLSETNLNIYAGLGFHHSQTNFKYFLDENNKDHLNLLKFSGSNFIGATQIHFILSDSTVIKANISGTPWFNWNYRILDITSHPAGTNWNYVISLEHDINPDWSLSVGYAGGSGKIEEHSRTAITFPEVNWSHSGFTASIGVSF